MIECGRSGKLNSPFLWECKILNPFHGNPMKGMVEVSKLVTDRNMHSQPPYSWECVSKS